MIQSNFEAYNFMNKAKSRIQITSNQFLSRFLDLIEIQNLDLWSLAFLYRCVSKGCDHNLEYLSERVSILGVTTRKLYRKEGYCKSMVVFSHLYIRLTLGYMIDIDLCEIHNVLQIDFHFGTLKPEHECAGQFLFVVNRSKYFWRYDAGISFPLSLCKLALILWTRGMTHCERMCRCKYQSNQSKYLLCLIQGLGLHLIPND